jgi:hypothetical protein
MPIYESRAHAVADRLMIVVELAWTAYPRAMAGPCSVVNALVGHVPVRRLMCRKCGATREWLTRAQYGVYAASGSVPHCRPNGALMAVSGGQAVTR